MASVNWIHMGQWPCFVGFTMDEAAFQKEMKRLNVNERVEWISNPHSDATTHSFTHKGKVCYIVCMRKQPKTRSKESIAALIAHEIMHIIQYMQDDYAGGKSLGVEAEAYLMQYLVMMMLSDVWNTKKTRATKPTKRAMLS